MSKRSQGERMEKYMRREQQRAALERTTERKFIVEEAMRNRIVDVVETLEAALREIEGMDDPGWTIGAARHVARKALNREDIGA